MARSTVGELYLLFKANSQGFTSEARRINRSLGGLARNVRDSNRDWRRMAGEVLAVVGAYKAMQATIRQVRTSFGVAVEFDKTRIALEGLLGSAERGSQFMQELKQLSLATPFQFKEMLNASRQLLAFGVEAENVLPLLARLGDIAAATGSSFEEMVFPIAQSHAEFKVVTRDIRQLASQGVPIIDELRKVFDLKTNEGVFKMAEEGRIFVPHLLQGIKQLTDEGGRFHGMTERLADSIFGVTEKFSDLKVLAREAFGAAIIDAFNLKEVMTGVFDALSTPVTSGALKETFTGLLTSMRDITLWFIAEIESLIRLLVKSIGGAIETVGRFMSDTLPNLPIIGEQFAPKRATRRVVRDPNESDVEFARRVTDEISALKAAGEQIVGVRHGTFGDIMSRMMEGFEFTLNRESPYMKAVENVKAFGEALATIDEKPFLADAIANAMHIDPSVLKMGVADFGKHLVDQWGQFSGRIRELGEQARDSTAGLLEETAARFRTGFDPIREAAKPVMDWLQKQGDEIAKIQGGPQVSILEQTFAKLAEAGLSRESEPFKTAVALAKHLDKQRENAEATKRLFKDSQKIIEDIKTPLERMTEFRADITRMLELGFLDFGQAARALDAARQKFHGVNGEGELRPFSEFRFASGPLSGKVAGADMPSLLQEQNRKQDTLIESVEDTNRLLEQGIKVRIQPGPGRQPVPGGF